jgi:hypothetical protein
MNDNEKYIEEYVNDIPFDAPDGRHRDTLKKQLLSAFPKHRLQLTVRTVGVWRTIMKSRIPKLAAAAVIIIAVSLGLTTLLDHPYAIAQTIKANHSVRYIHIKNFKPDEEESREFWLEFHEDGQVRNVRMHMPEWDSGDGAKVIVWKENKAQVWLQKKNILITIRDKTVAAQMLKLVEEFDPRRAVEHLHEQKKQGKVKIEIDEPSDKCEPIVVTATYLPESSTPNRRMVLFVEQTTKLVTAMKLYQLKDSEYQYKDLMEYYGYNQPIEAKMFILDGVPADVMRIDQTTQEVGLVQGQLSDEEIAVEVARQFFEALIAVDYSEAGRLLEGMPADRMQQLLGHIKFLRIISIGPAGPHPISETRGLVVPCTVEIEKEGEISEWKFERLGVRQVHGQPGRWTIFGGI